MPERLHLRARISAVFLALAVVGALSTTLASPASADEPVDNCAAPTQAECPAGSDNFTDTDVTPNIVQTSSGGTNFFKCVQSATANASLSCSVKQTNTSGLNQAIYSQSIAIDQSGIGLAGVDQSGTVSVDIEQDNVSGANIVGSAAAPSVQTINESATSANLPSTTHSQTGRQNVTIDQFSISGDQDTFVDQNLTLTSTTSAVGDVAQTQNTDVGSDGPDADSTPDKHQHVDLNILTTTGVNTIDVDQLQNLTQSATGVVVTANQSQGSAVNASGADLDWFADSHNKTNATADQEKHWTQGATVVPVVGSWTHTQEDGLDILGKLPSTHDAITNQLAELIPGGRCRQDLVLFTKTIGRGTQTCSFPTQAKSFSHTHEDEDFEMHQDCSPEDATCDRQEVIVNQPSEVVCNGATIPCQGLGDGFWDNHTGAWADADRTTSQRLDSVFTIPAAFSDLADDSFATALDYPNASGLRGAALRLLKKGVTGDLNANHPGVDYNVHSTAVAAQVSVALNGTATDMHELASQLEGYNEQGCTSLPGDSSPCPT